MKLTELLENISDVDTRFKALVNTLFHSTSGNLIRGEEYSKSFDEYIFDEAEKRINSELKYLNEKLDQCKDRFRGVLLLKNKSRKRSQKQNKTEKQQIKSKHFKQLLRADLNSDVIGNVNVESLDSECRISFQFPFYLFPLFRMGIILLAGSSTNGHFSQFPRVSAYERLYFPILFKIKKREKAVG